MRLLVLLHRWLGIPFSLLFAMWFASGIVMHFVPFPSLTETERVDGLAPLDLEQMSRSPAAAAIASTIANPTRVRMLQRSDGPVYVISGSSGLVALHASDLTKAALTSDSLALAIAKDHGRRRGIDVTNAAVSGLIPFDQWTVPGPLDRHRPLYRIVLNDEAGTTLYVSSKTGEVVRDTTRRERQWNHLGSLMHWIYPVILRGHPVAWERTVWGLSLVALIVAAVGAVLGVGRAEVGRYRLVLPYRGWHRWHHALGLGCMIFVLTWISSGWLSLDSGRLFSTGRPTEVEADVAAGAPSWAALPTPDWRQVSPRAREVEWFAFDRHIYRRERTGVDTQILFPGNANAAQPRAFLTSQEVGAFAERLASGCGIPRVVEADDNYAIAASVPNAPVYRVVCGEVWFHIDGASGAMLERLDVSRRAYRWLYSAFHTFDLPVLVAHPILRSVLIVSLCGIGFAFSMTGVVIGFRRLRSTFRVASPGR
jgi:PepSY-associated TM region